MSTTLQYVLIFVGLLAMAWIATTYQPRERKLRRYGEGHDVIVSCASAEDQAEVFYILTADVQDGALPTDAYVHMAGDPTAVPSARKPKVVHRGCNAKVADAIWEAPPARTIADAVQGVR